MKKQPTIHQEFSCYRDGLKICGSMFKPKGDGPFPTIIVSHEFMMNRMTTFLLAKKFAQMGYAAFCFDFNGGGSISQSKGKTTEMSVMTEKADLYAVMDYVKALPFTDMENFNLMGCSQGGFVSALAAAELGNEIVKKLILYYPALSIPDDARKGSMILAKFDPANVPKTLFCGPIILGRQYVLDVIDLDPFSMINKYTGPILLIHGNADHIVAYEYSVRAYEVYKAAGADIEFVTINGGGHLLPKPSHRAEAWQNVKKFMSI